MQADKGSMAVLVEMHHAGDPALRAEVVTTPQSRFLLTPTLSGRRIRPSPLSQRALQSWRWSMYQPPVRGRPVLAGKKVLLIDPYRPTRDVRASVLQSHDIELDTAESLQAARGLWRPRFYNWIMLDVKRCLPGEALAFYDEIRDKSPRERVVFFVGPPTYLTRTCPDQSSEVASEAQQWAETVKRLLAAA